MFLGMDGSPRRPFDDQVTDLFLRNGGLGEPALLKAPANHPVSL